MMESKGVNQKLNPATLIKMLREGKGWKVSNVNSMIGEYNKLF